MINTYTTTNFYLVGATVRFEQEAYSVDECNKNVQPVLILNDPFSIDITVKVFSTDESATGKLKTMYCLHDNLVDTCILYTFINGLSI